MNPTKCIGQRQRVKILLEAAEKQRREQGGESTVLKVCREDYLTHYRFIEKQLNQNNLYLRIMDAT